VEVVVVEVGQLQQLAMVSPHSLYYHLAQLNSQNGLFQVTLRGYHINHGM